MDMFMFGMAIFGIFSCTILFILFIYLIFYRLFISDYINFIKSEKDIEDKYIKYCNDKKLVLKKYGLR
jgi:hypothetical protein